MSSNPEEEADLLTDEIFVAATALMLCLVGIRIFKHYHIKAIPESTAVIITGVVISLLLKLSERTLDVEIHVIYSFPRAIFFYVLLPPIILYSGYSLKKRHFFKNIGIISVLAVAGTLAQTVIFGIAISYFSELNLLEALIFGSLISATDPVAVISQYTELGVNQTLFGICAGESVMNDAVAIVLFDTFSHMLHMREIDVDESIFDGMYTFTFIMLGSIVLGFAVGMLTSLVMKHMSLDHRWDTSMLLVTAYMSYIAGDVLNLSGIVAVFFTGIADSHYTYHALSSSEAQDFSMWFFDLLGNICETFVFLFLGLSVIPYASHFDWTLTIVSFIVCVVSRFLLTFSLTSMVNIGRKHKVSAKQMMAISWGGLRGAIAFALALVYPVPALRELVTATTVAMVVLTVFIFGSTNVALLTYLGGMFGDGDEVDVPRDQLVQKSGTLSFDAKYIVPLISVSREQRKRPSPKYMVVAPGVGRDHNYVALDEAHC